MKKDDTVSFLISIIINISILLLIPKISTKLIENKKIKVGLVSVDIPQKSVSNKQKNIDKKPLNKPEPKKEDIKKINAQTLKRIADKIESPKIDILTIDRPNARKKSIKKLEKNYQEKEIKNDNNFSKNIDFELEKIQEKNIVLKENSKKIIKIEDNASNFKIDKIKIKEDENVGLPSGYKLGSVDGDIIAKWDSNNKPPIYPDSAQLKGLHGKVKIRITIDEFGNVLHLKIENGSGVPEINNAIEKVAHSWKIYLSKNGLNVKGDVILEYDFILK